MKAVGVVVRGHVQGVGFRHYVRMKALELAVVGRVWNREDGAVEIEAQSTDPIGLDRFVESLWSGPGRVDDVSLREIEPREDRVGFAVWR